MIRRKRNIKSIANHPQDIEVNRGGLNHQDICAFGVVELSLTHRLARVWRVHLVSAPVAKLRRTLRCSTRRTREPRPILDGIRHNGGVLEPLAVQHFANREMLDGQGFENTAIMAYA